MRKRHAVRAGAAGLVLIGAGLCVGAAAWQPGDEPAAAESEIALLERIVSLRERQLKEEQIAGAKDAEALSAARLQLLRDRARLAEATGDRAALRQHLDEVVTILQERLTASRALYDTGRLSGRELAESEIAVLEARLERAQLLGE